MEVRDKRTYGWFRISNDILDRYGEELGPYGIAVYAALSRRVDNKTQETHPSLKTLAKSIGISRAKVFTVLKELETRKLIEVQPRYTPEGDRTSSSYYLLDIPTVDRVVHSVPYGVLHSGPPVVHDVDHRVPHNGQYQDSVDQDSSSYQDSPGQDTLKGECEKNGDHHKENGEAGWKGANDFSHYWELHPGPKGSKQDAIAAYKKNKPPAHALAAMERQIEYKAACDQRGKFCPQLPHLHRWFAHKRWEDEIPQAPMTQAERLWAEGQRQEEEERSQHEGDER